MTLYIYGYKTTENGTVGVYKAQTNDFWNAAKTARELYARGISCNVIGNGKTLIKY